MSELSRAAHFFCASFFARVLCKTRDYTKVIITNCCKRITFSSFFQGTFSSSSCSMRQNIKRGRDKVERREWKSRAPGRALIFYLVLASPQLQIEIMRARLFTSLFLYQPQCKQGAKCITL